MSVENVVFIGEVTLPPLCGDCDHLKDLIAEKAKIGLTERDIAVSALSGCRRGRLNNENIPCGMQESPSDEDNRILVRLDLVDVIKATLKHS